MKKILPFIIVCLFSCKKNTTKTESNQTLDTTHLVSLDETKGSATFDTLNVTQFNALFKETELTQYNKNVSRLFEKHLQRGIGFWTTKCLMVNDTVKNLPIAGYPLSLKSLNGEFRRITTLNESENQLTILAWILDKKYNVIDMHRLTGIGGDENVGEHFYGEFMNDSVYRYVDKLYQYDDDGRVDSTTQVVFGCLIFTDKGKIARLETCR